VQEGTGGLPPLTKPPGPCASGKCFAGPGAPPILGQVWEEVAAGAAACAEIPGCPAAAAGAPIAGVAAQAGKAVVEAAPKIWEWIKVQADDILTWNGQRVDPKTGRKAYGSGEPGLHSKDYATRKAAKDAARQRGAREPTEADGPHRKGGRHLHPVDDEGNDVHDGMHDNFPY
jgi:hypothetical protein